MVDRKIRKFLFLSRDAYRRFCIRITDIRKLSAFQTQTWQDLGKIENPPQDILSLLEEI